LRRFAVTNIDDLLSLEFRGLRKLVSFRQATIPSLPTNPGLVQIIRRKRAEILAEQFLVGGAMALLGDKDRTIATGRWAPTKARFGHTTAFINLNQRVGAALREFAKKCQGTMPLPPDYGVWFLQGLISLK
jgi:hypothetical protein